MQLKKKRSQFYDVNQVILKSSVRKTGACNQCGYVFLQGGKVFGEVVEIEGNVTMNALLCPQCRHAFGIIPKNNLKKGFSHAH